jgi:DNA polymerase III gamma/tau subunit
MSAESLLTKYRPQSFAEVIGQDTAISAFRTAVANGIRAFVFCGNSGVGKTTLARLAAKYLGAGRVIEVDAATCNGVDDMRELTAPYAYHLADTRANIIDEVQRLTPPAWTVLLKTLEDSEAYWFLITTDPSKVPDNIGTRCVLIRLQDVGSNDLVELLATVCKQERWNTPDAVLALCAQEARGAPRRALTFLAVCSDCTTRKQAAAMINVTVAEDRSPAGLGYRLAKALATPRWPEIQPILREIRGSDAHPSIRRVVCAYYETVIANSEDEHAVCYAARVLDHFAEPMTEMSALFLAVCRIVFGKEN